MLRRRKRIGCFEIHQNIIENYPEIAKKIMGECIIIRAEAIYNRSVIEYTAFSDKFDEISVGEIAPKYNITVTKLAKGVRINWTKEKE